MAKISIFGLGYVGAVSIAALADNDNEIIGVDCKYHQSGDDQCWTKPNY